MSIKIVTKTETIEFGVTALPNRKNKILYKARGATLEALAYFRNDECADEFDKMLNRIIEIINRGGIE